MTITNTGQIGSILCPVSGTILVFYWRHVMRVWPITIALFRLWYNNKVWKRIVFSEFLLVFFLWFSLIFCLVSCRRLWPSVLYFVWCHIVCVWFAITHRTCQSLTPSQYLATTCRKLEVMLSLRQLLPLLMALSTAEVVCHCVIQYLLNVS